MTIYCMVSIDLVVTTGVQLEQLKVNIVLYGMTVENYCHVYFLHNFYMAISVFFCNICSDTETSVNNLLSNVRGLGGGPHNLLRTV